MPRILVGVDRPSAASAALLAAVEIAVRDGSTIDLVARVPRRYVMHSFALMATGCLPCDFEAEEAKELEDQMRELVASVPPELSIRRWLLVGGRRGRFVDLAIRDGYDMVVVGGGLQARRGAVRVR